MNEEDFQQIILRLERLENAVFRKVKRKTGAFVSEETPEDLDFSINIRAFVKRYAASKSGPEKFVLLLAYLTKGQEDQNVRLNEIVKQWKKMSGKNLLGNFNRFYPNEAKTRGWVDSKGYGEYCLTTEWRQKHGR